MNDKTKEKIDNMTYTEMLRLWRFAPSGHSMFVGKVGEYFKERMAIARDLVGDKQHTLASKEIGW